MTQSAMNRDYNLKFLSVFLLNSHGFLLIELDSNSQLTIIVDTGSYLFNKTTITNFRETCLNQWEKPHEECFLVLIWNVNLSNFSRPY